MDVQIILKIAAIGLLTAIISILLKKSDKDDIATLVTVAGLVIVLFIVVDMVAELFETLKDLFELKIFGLWIY
mgnify:FL=1